MALHAADRDGGVVADDLGGDLDDDLGNDRVDLAGHDRRALLQLGQEDLAETGARPRAHQPEVVGDLRQRDGNGLERARQLDQRIARALSLEGVGGRLDRQAGLSRRATADARGELRMGVSPVPVAVPPSGIWPTRSSVPPTRS